MKKFVTFVAATLTLAMLGTISACEPTGQGETTAQMTSNLAGTGGVVHIEIFRTSETTQSTQGYLTAGNLTLYTLELPDRNNASTNNYHTAGRVPAGTYQAHIRTDNNSGKNLGWRLQLENVLDRTLIEIHAGKTPKNTTGCILIGTGSAPDQLSGDITARGLLQKEVEKAGKDARIEVTIHDPVKPDTGSVTINSLTASVVSVQKQSDGHSIYTFDVEGSGTVSGPPGAYMNVQLFALRYTYKPVQGKQVKAASWSSAGADAGRGATDPASSGWTVSYEKVTLLDIEFQDYSSLRLSATISAQSGPLAEAHADLTLPHP